MRRPCSGVGKLWIQAAARSCDVNNVDCRRVYPQTLSHDVRHDGDRMVSLLACVKAGLMRGYGLRERNTCVHTASACRYVEVHVKPG
jgi:hypothetical protein